MKILLVHNYYRSAIPSGENTVVEAETRLLKDAGHVVEMFTRSNDELGSAPIRTALTGALLTAHNPFMAAALRQRLQAFRPDVVHFHNTFPLLSPALLAVAREEGAAVVATLHNYRLFCAQGGLLRERRICTECLDRGHAWPAVRHACRSSRLATLPVASMIDHHLRRDTWNRAPHALIVLTEFQKTLMQRAGVRADLLQVKPNFAGSAPTVPWAARENAAVYLGRVCEEKGIWTLLAAWEQLGARAPLLKVIGAGPALEPLRARVAGSAVASRIRILGALPHAEATRELANARLLVYPSIWYEPFGMSIVEAYARAVPVLTSRLGSLPDLVREGRSGALFAAGDGAALAREVQRLWAEPGLLTALSVGALDRWQQHYRPETNLRRLEEIYRGAREAREGFTAGPREARS